MKKEILFPCGWEQGVCGFDCPGYEGRPIKVTVYSATQEITLFLNGKEVGRKHTNQSPARSQSPRKGIDLRETYCGRRE